MKTGISRGGEGPLTRKLNLAKSNYFLFILYFIGIEPISMKLRPKNLNVSVISMKNETY